MAGPEARDFFTVSDWGRRDPTEYPVANSMSSVLQKPIIVIKCYYKRCVLLEKIDCTVF